MQVCVGVCDSSMQQFAHCTPPFLCCQFLVRCALHKPPALCCRLHTALLKTKKLDSTSCLALHHSNNQLARPAYMCHAPFAQAHPHPSTLGNVLHPPTKQIDPKCVLPPHTIKSGRELLSIPDPPQVHQTSGAETHRNKSITGDLLHWRHDVDTIRTGCGGLSQVRHHTRNNRAGTARGVAICQP